MTPEDIPLGWYTHINFAFALVNPTTFHVDAMDADTASLYQRVTALKSKQPNLQVWIGKLSCRRDLSIYNGLISMAS